MSTATKYVPKVGDRVRVTKDLYFGTLPAGTEGTVSYLVADGLPFLWLKSETHPDNSVSGRGWALFSNEVEKID